MMDRVTRFQRSVVILVADGMSLSDARRTLAPSRRSEDREVALADLDLACETLHRSLFASIPKEAAAS